MPSVVGSAACRSAARPISLSARTGLGPRVIFGRDRELRRTRPAARYAPETEEAPQAFPVNKTRSSHAPATNRRSHASIGVGREHRGWPREDSGSPWRHVARRAVPARRAHGFLEPRWSCRPIQARQLLSLVSRRSIKFGLTCDVIACVRVNMAPTLWVLHGMCPKRRAQANNSAAG